MKQELYRFLLSCGTPGLQEQDESTPAANPFRASSTGPTASLPGLSPLLQAVPQHSSRVKTGPDCVKDHTTSTWRATYRPKHTQLGTNICFGSRTEAQNSTRPPLASPAASTKTSQHQNPTQKHLSRDYGSWYHLHCATSGSKFSDLSSCILNEFFPNELSHVYQGS